MADAAANIAMDTQTSSQVHHPTTRVQHAELEADQTFIVWLTRHAWEIGHERVTQKAKACGLGVCQREW
jgi:hypothetical protein